MHKFKIVYIDDLSPYSRNLYSKLFAHRKYSFVFYAPKSIFGKIFYESTLPNMKRVWSSHLYPFQIVRETAKDKPDLVHIQFELNTFGSFHTAILVFPLLLLLKVLRRKVAITIHTVIPRFCLTSKFTQVLIPSMFRTWHVPISLYETVLSFVYSMLDRFSEGLIVHTDTQKRYLTQDYNVNSRKIFVIPQGVDYTAPVIDREKVRYWRKKTGNKSIILYFGSITPIKGLDWLIQSFSQLRKSYPNCVLIIIGVSNYYYADYYQEIRRLVDSLKLAESVFFAGYVNNRSELDSIFSLANVIVFSHVFPHSPSGTVAMVKKHKKRLIASNFKILKEQLIDYKKVVFVPPEDREFLAAALLSAMTDDSSESRDAGTFMPNDSWNSVAFKTLLSYEYLLRSETTNHTFGCDLNKRTE